jgi:hypothetical protein
MSDLRERIANVLLPDLEYAAAYNPIQDPQEQAYTLADAVIAAIQLQPEYGHLDETDSGIIADTIPELGEPCPGETLRHRYITPWKDINETD